MKGLRSTEITSGTPVRLTGSYLRSTGQVTGGEGSSRWKLEGSCSCGCIARAEPGSIIAVNEPADPMWFTAEELAASPRWRHINAANLQVVGGKPKATDYP
jgi:hypothetical protein